MLDDDTFETALDLIKAFATATEEQIQLQTMAQLLQVEQSMSLSQQCDYAMRLCAKVNHMSVEAVEEMHNLNAVKLEQEDTNDLDKFINAHRQNLIARFHQEAISNAALKALSGLKELNAPDDLVDAVTKAALGAASLPPPNARMN